MQLLPLLHQKPCWWGWLLLMCQVVIAVQLQMSLYWCLPTSPQQENCHLTSLRPLQVTTVHHYCIYWQSC